MAETVDTKRQTGRRFWDHVYYWMPIVLSLVLSGMSRWIESERTVNRLEQSQIETKLEMQGETKLINFRLGQIEAWQRSQAANK